MAIITYSVTKNGETNIEFEYPETPLGRAVYELWSRKPSEAKSYPEEKTLIVFPKGKTYARWNQGRQEIIDFVHFQQLVTLCVFLDNQGQLQPRISNAFEKWQVESVDHWITLANAEYQLWLWLFKLEKIQDYDCPELGWMHTQFEWWAEEYSSTILELGQKSILKNWRSRTEKIQGNHNPFNRKDDREKHRFILVEATRSFANKLAMSGQSEDEYELLRNFNSKAWDPYQRAYQNCRNVMRNGVRINGEKHILHTLELHGDKISTNSTSSTKRVVKLSTKKSFHSGRGRKKVK